MLTVQLYRKPSSSKLSISFISGRKHSRIITSLSQVPLALHDLRVHSVMHSVVFCVRKCKAQGNRVLQSKLS